MMRFDEEFDKLTSGDQNLFAKVVNTLFLRTFIVREVFDAREKMIKLNPDYRYIERHYELITEYLSFSGWLLENDAINGVITLVNANDQNRIKLDRETSLILYFLRLLYEKEKNESNAESESVYVQTNQLVRSMLEHGVVLPGKRLTNRGVCRCLRTLANRNVIVRISGSYDNGDVSFYILPSIIHAIDQNKIAAMSDAIDRMKSEGLITDEDLRGEDA